MFKNIALTPVAANYYPGYPRSLYAPSHRLSEAMPLGYTQAYGVGLLFPLG